MSQIQVAVVLVRGPPPARAADQGIERRSATRSWPARPADRSGSGPGRAGSRALAARAPTRNDADADHPPGQAPRSGSSRLTDAQQHQSQQQRERPGRPPPGRTPRRARVPASRPMPPVSTPARKSSRWPMIRTTPGHQQLGEVPERLVPGGEGLLGQGVEAAGGVVAGPGVEVGVRVRVGRVHERPATPGDQVQLGGRVRRQRARTAGSCARRRRPWPGSRTPAG